MNKKSNRVPSAGTKAEKSTKVETRLPSSPTIGNTHVVRSPNVVSTEKLNDKLIQECPPPTIRKGRC